MFLLVSLLSLLERFDQMIMLKKVKFVYTDIVLAILAKASKKSAPNEDLQMHGLMVTRGRSPDKKSNHNQKNCLSSMNKYMSKVDALSASANVTLRYCPERNDNSSNQEDEQ